MVIAEEPRTTELHASLQRARKRKLLGSEAVSVRGSRLDEGAVFLDRKALNLVRAQAAEFAGVTADAQDISLAVGDHRDRGRGLQQCIHDRPAVSR